MLELFRALMPATDDRERGATAVEYGLMVALIAAIIVGAVFALGGSVDDTFEQTNTCITTPEAEECQ